MPLRRKPDGSRLEIREIAPDIFAKFARRHGTSEEIGPIATIFDKPEEIDEKIEVKTLGLFGCGTLCAVCACTVTSSEGDTKGGLKLDSIIVDRELRRRGLAGLLVAKSFHALLCDADRTVSMIYSHAVHPATERLLRSMSFDDPPPVGAPISAYRLDDASRKALLIFCDIQMRRATDRLKLQCSYCEDCDRRAQPWCRPRGANPRKFRR